MQQLTRFYWHGVLARSGPSAVPELPVNFFVVSVIAESYMGT